MGEIQKLKENMPKLTEEEKRRLESALAEFEQSQALLEVLKGQIALLTNSMSEVSTTAETIKNLRKLESGAEILVPIGSDSFVRAKLPSLDKIMTGVGAGVVVERDPEETIKFLETRTAEISKTIQELRARLESLGERIESLRPEIERLLAKSRGK